MTILLLLVEQYDHVSNTWALRPAGTVSSSAGAREAQVYRLCLSDRSCAPPSGLDRGGDRRPEGEETKAVASLTGPGSSTRGLRTRSRPTPLERRNPDREARSGPVHRMPGLLSRTQRDARMSGAPRTSSCGPLAAKPRVTRGHRRRVLHADPLCLRIDGGGASPPSPTRTPGAPCQARSVNGCSAERVSGPPRDCLQQDRSSAGGTTGRTSPRHTGRGTRTCRRRPVSTPGSGP